MAVAGMKDMMRHDMTQRGLMHAAVVLCGLAMVETGCGRMLDGDEREPFGTHGDGEGDDLDDEDPRSGGELSESCFDGEVQPGEVCQVQEPETLPAGVDPCSLSVADFDVDGRPDLAVPNSDPYIPPSGTHVATVLRGFGNGSFGDSKPYAAGAELPVGLAVGDFDGDGMVDVVTANHDAQQVFMLGNDGGAGAMGFEDPSGTFVGSTASSITAGDYTGDGIDDVVVNTPDGVALAHGTASGELLYVDTLSVGGMAAHSVLADLDGDGKLDLATVSNDGLAGGLWVWQGGGDGSFPELNHMEVAGTPQWVSVGDLNMDGDLDLVVSSHVPSQVAIYAGSGHGGFAEPWTYPVCGGPQAVALGDMNNDGATDMVVTCTESDLIEMYVQGLDGEFELARWWGTGSRPVSAQVADFNLDGMLDIAWANQFSNSVGLVMSHP